MFSVAISLYGCSAFIEYYDWQAYSHMMFVILIFVIFGMLLIGIWYQLIQLIHGKTIEELIF